MLKILKFIPKIIKGGAVINAFLEALSLFSKRLDENPNINYKSNLKDERTN